MSADSEETKDEFQEETVTITREEYDRLNKEIKRLKALVSWLQRRPVNSNIDSKDVNSSQQLLVSNDKQNTTNTTALTEYAMCRYLQENGRKLDGRLLVFGYVRPFYANYYFDCIICIVNFFLPMPVHDETPLGLFGEIHDKAFPHIPNIPLTIQSKCLESFEEAKLSGIDMFVQYHKDKMSREKKDIMQWPIKDIMLSFIPSAIKFSCSSKPTWEFAEYLWWDFKYVKKEDEINNMDDFYRQFPMNNRANHIWKRTIDGYHLKKHRGKYECCRQICRNWIGKLNAQYFGVMPNQTYNNSTECQPVIGTREKELKNNKWYCPNRLLVCGYFRQHCHLGTISTSIVNCCMYFLRDFNLNLIYECDDNVFIRNRTEMMSLNDRVLAELAFEFKFIHQKFETYQQLFLYLKRTQKMVKLDDGYRIFQSSTTARRIVVVNMELNARINPDGNSIYLVGGIGYRKGKCLVFGLWTRRIVERTLSINAIDLPIRSPNKHGKYCIDSLHKINYEICNLKNVKIIETGKNSNNALKMTYEKLHECIENSTGELIEGVIIDCLRGIPGYYYVHRFLPIYINNNNEETKNIAITFDEKGMPKYCFCDGNQIITALMLFNPNLDVTGNNFRWLQYCIDVQFHDTSAS